MLDTVAEPAGIKLKPRARSPLRCRPLDQANGHRRAAGSPAIATYYYIARSIDTYGAHLQRWTERGEDLSRLQHNGRDDQPTVVQCERVGREREARHQAAADGGSKS
jgi:hypothetical protein